MKDQINYGATLDLFCLALEGVASKGRSYSGIQDSFAWMKALILQSTSILI
jgi:hypothetical protein